MGKHLQKKEWIKIQTLLDVGKSIDEISVYLKNKENSTWLPAFPQLNGKLGFIEIVPANRNTFLHTQENVISSSLFEYELQNLTPQIYDKKYLDTKPEISRFFIFGYSEFLATIAGFVA